jgi:pyruvate dehydrogenase E1 component alpha subunit
MALDKDALLAVYRTMQTIRVFEDRVHVENTTGDIPGFVHLYAGEEAIATGVCCNLTDADAIGSTHRGHGHCIAKGCDVKAMMKELFGKKEGLCGGKGGSMHIADMERGMLGANAIVGGSPPLAIGAALSHKTRGTDGVAVSFSGDGASNQGTCFESLNMAVVLNLPCIFVFENNGFGEGTGADYHVGSGDIGGRAAAFGMPMTKVDGVDFFAVQEAAAEAIGRARRGEGPSVIEADVVRFYGHYEGDPQGYRKKGEGDEMRATRDCLKNFRDKTLGDGTLTATELDAIDAEIAQLIDEAVVEARAAEFPPVDDLLTDVYISY